MFQQLNLYWQDKPTSTGFWLSLNKDDNTFSVVVIVDAAKKQCDYGMLSVKTNGDYRITYANAKDAELLKKLDHGDSNYVYAKLDASVLNNQPPERVSANRRAAVNATLKKANG